jgi:hypothetical protein
MPHCEHEGNCHGCYGLGDGYVGASEVEYGLENGSEPRDYRGPFWGIHFPRERIRLIEIQRQLGLLRRQWAINRLGRRAMTRLGDEHPWSALLLGRLLSQVLGVLMRKRHRRMKS